MTSLTLFQSVFDNKTHRSMKFSSFDGMEELLYDLSKQPGYKPKKSERKLGSPLISPSSYKPGTTRANDNVVSWNGWAALDVDDYEGFLEYFRLGSLDFADTQNGPAVQASMV